MRSRILGMFLLCLSWAAWAGQSPIRPGSPETYTVMTGDTLWGISSKFLRSPWMWSELWYANPQIKNPHKIYPGDTISVVNVAGKPRLMLSRRGSDYVVDQGTVKLSPSVRVIQSDREVPSVSLGTIRAFLKDSRMFDSRDELEQAPRIFASESNRMIFSKGDLVYVRGNLSALRGNLKLYRIGSAVLDPDNNEYLGIMGHAVAEAEIVDVSDGKATIRIGKGAHEVKIGDKVLSEDVFSHKNRFIFRSPDAKIDGKIVSTLSGSSKISVFDSIIVNKGERESLRQGDVLKVQKKPVVKDTVSGELVELPAETIGMVMIYHPFEKLSYGIVLSAFKEISIGDVLINP